MIILRWSSMGILAITVCIYTILISCLVWRHVDRYQDLLKFVSSKQRLFDLQKDAADGTCSICLGDFKDELDKPIIQLKCDISHIFHSKCLEKWIKTNDECPLCRTKIATWSSFYYRCKIDKFEQIDWISKNQSS